MNHKSLALAACMTGLLLLPVQGFPTGLAIPSVSAQSATSQLSPEQLHKLARSITVRIVSEDTSGSGILIKKEGQVYTVLTNQHVLTPGEPIRIQTPDNSFHPATLVTEVNFQGKDLALLQFRASVDYEVASLTNLATVAVNEPIFAAGFSFETDSSKQGGFILTEGQVLYVPKQALKEGYQIGYSNNIEKGMSGGPILNIEGQVIGINGIHAEPLWGDPYVYEDGSRPTDAERDLMSRYSWGIPLQTFAQLAPEYASQEALAGGTPSVTGENLPPIANDVNNIAQQITVQIDVPNTPNCKGSGVIVGKNGNTYTVLTAEHVVRETEECDRRTLEIITPDTRRYSVDVNNNKVKILPGVDLAVLQFTSNFSYQVATLARHDLEKKGGVVFVSGLLGSTIGEGKINRLFTVGKLFNKEWGSISVKDSLSLSYGYGLVYTNITKAGVSGGPVLDIRGHVIGIHGRADGEAVVDEAGAGSSIHLGYSLGIPISTFLSLVTEIEIEPNQLKIYTAKPPSLTAQETKSIIDPFLKKVQEPNKSSNAIDWLNYGNQLWRLEQHKEALIAFDQAIQLQPDFYQAWYSRGLVLFFLQQYSEALESFDRAIQESQEKFVLAWRGRGQALINLQRYPEALVSIEKVIALNPKDFLVRVDQGIILQTQERYQEAIVAYNEAIEINPHPLAYNNRAFVKSQLRDKEGALADVNKAIKINPNYAQSYLQRSGIQFEWGNKKESLADLNKAIEIAPYYADAYLRRGSYLYHYGNREEGIADLGKAIRLNPNNAYFYYRWGGLYSNEGDNQEAIFYYDKAIKLNPNFSTAYYDRGLVYIKLRDR
ncbi:MAG: serine protease, partial [Symploca sp. SIO2E6]|nr:serine protease [Symploca sp. SIO2E6]